MRRCGDEDDATAIVRGATSRASGELPRLWRLETRHQEALTGATAAWGWEATAQVAVSKQTSAFVCFDCAVTFLTKKSYSVPHYGSIICKTELICSVFYNTISCAGFVTNIKRFFLFSVDSVESGRYCGEYSLIVMDFNLFRFIISHFYLQINNEVAHTI